MADNAPQPPPVIFCQDSPKRVLVSVIRTTPIKPTCGGGGEPEPPPPLIPTSPGFSDFMVYPWRWGENAHNVTLSPGASRVSGGGGKPSCTSPSAGDLRELPRVPLRGEGSCGGGGAPRDSAGSGATEEGWWAAIYGVAQSRT